MLILRPIFTFAHRLFYHKIASEDSSQNTTVDASIPSLYQGIIHYERGNKYKRASEALNAAG